MSDESLPRWMRRIPTTSGDVPDAVPAVLVRRVAPSLPTELAELADSRVVWLRVRVGRDGTAR